MWDAVLDRSGTDPHLGAGNPTPLDEDGAVKAFPLAAAESCLAREVAARLSKPPSDFR
jgi:hypothetical protein